MNKFSHHYCLAVCFVAAVVLRVGPVAAQSESVRPGINKSFEDPNLQESIDRFEGANREIAKKQKEILAACQLRPGMVVADIGAGTGLFTRLFAAEVGPQGRVYAVDIAQKFIEHIEKTVQEAGLSNVTGVVCTPTSAQLPPNSVDLAFICDTYHHFEFPQKTMASIHQALRPGGQLILIEFHRVKGKVPDRMLSHVRAGQEVFVKEIEDAGFHKVNELDLLKENYFVRFQKVDAAASSAARKDEPAPAAVDVGSSEKALAQQILAAAGVKGGLIVQVGCGDGRLTAALRANESYLVHGLDADAKNIAAARRHIRSLGLYGKVSVEPWTGQRLPYVDNLVNLLVICDAQAAISDQELQRVLAPGGVAVRLDPKSKIRDPKFVKPWPQQMDQWTHALHGPDNNAVAQDAVVGPPRHLQWVGGPPWARSHDHLASVSVVVSSAGRIFSIVDEGPIAAAALPAQWSLMAQDGFSGVVLWQRPIESWEGHLRGFRTGPTAISRRLVAIGDTVYVTLGYGQPVTALKAATGETVRTYRGTENTLEILCSDGVLFLAIGDALGHGAEATTTQRGDFISPGKKRLLAIKADTGDVVWQKADADTSELMPTALAVAGGRVFFENSKELICLNAASGHENWRAPRPITVNRWAWSTPTLVAYGEVVLSADRDVSSKVSPEADAPGALLWNVHSLGGETKPGELIAFSAQTGQRLWSSKCREGYNSPVDVLVADGLVWTGNLVGAADPGITEGLDPLSGKVMRTRPADSSFFTPGMGHHRCYRNKATEQYLLVGRGGTEFVDVASGKAVPNHWVRGACQYGVVPCNGLLYAPPHSCACFIEAKLNGFNALASRRDGGRGARDEGLQPPALEQGPAYQEAPGHKGTARLSSPKSKAQREDDWSTFRHDAARSGRTPSAVPTALKQAWQTKLNGRLSSPVVAEGKVFLAEIDAHTVHALAAASGEPLWSYTAGGRIDSPPTIYNSLALFGSADGWVYCLRAADGQLVWRFRAAPDNERLVAYGQIESVWPVPGNVLVHEGSAYFAAGRSSYLDGGMHLYRLDAATGKMLSHKRLDGRDPATGEQPRNVIKGVNMPGALPDVLSCDGSSIYLRHLRFDLNGAEQTTDVPHLFAPAGFLDDSWWHRTYWIFGTRMNSGWGGWLTVGRTVPAGRLMVLDDAAVYSFGRLNQYARNGAHVGLDGTLLPWPLPPAGTTWPTTQYRLFACAKSPKVIEIGSEKDTQPTTAPAKERSKRAAAGKNRGGGENTAIECQWSEAANLWVRAMVLAGKTLFLAGPPEPVVGRAADVAAYEGKKGGLLEAVATADGKKLAEYRLDSPPVLDGLSAAGGRLYLCTQDGRVLCMSGADTSPTP